MGGWGQILRITKYTGDGGHHRPPDSILSRFWIDFGRFLERKSLIFAFCGTFFRCKSIKKLQLAKKCEKNAKLVPPAGGREAPRRLTPPRKNFHARGLEAFYWKISTPCRREANSLCYAHTAGLPQTRSLKSVIIYFQVMASPRKYVWYPFFLYRWS